MGQTSSETGVQLALTMGRNQEAATIITVVIAPGLSLMILKEAHLCLMKKGAEVLHFFAPPAY